LHALTLRERLFEPPHLLFEQTSLVADGADSGTDVTQEFVCASTVVAAYPRPREMCRFDVLRCQQDKPSSSTAGILCGRARARHRRTPLLAPVSRASEADAVTLLDDEHVVRRGVVVPRRVGASWSGREKGFPGPG
jgi:hypothetical protein